MMLSRDVCRIHFCVQVHARASEGKIWEKWLAPASTYWTGFFLLFPHGDCDWRFVCFLSRRHGIRGVDVDSIVHISVGPQSEKGPAETCVCVCDLGSIIFRGRVPYFSTYYCGPHERSSDEYWIGLDWTGNLEIAVLRSQPDGWYAPLDDFSKQSPTCSQMGARIACPDVARLWIPVCCAAARFAVELRVCRTPSRQDAFSSGMSSLI
jgi:hypothetical protein